MCVIIVVLVSQCENPHRPTLACHPLDFALLSTNTEADRGLIQRIFECNDNDNGNDQLPLVEPSIKMSQGNFNSRRLTLIIRGRDAQKDRITRIMSLPHGPDRRIRSFLSSFDLHRWGTDMILGYDGEIGTRKIYIDQPNQGIQALEIFPDGKTQSRSYVICDPESWPKWVKNFENVRTVYRCQIRDRKTIEDPYHIVLNQTIPVDLGKGRQIGLLTRVARDFGIEKSFREWLRKLSQTPCGICVISFQLRPGGRGFKSVNLYVRQTNRKSRI
jgi:hypothetical protein